MNSLKTLNEYGQSVWLDYIRRSLITTGELRRLIDEDGLRGVTSNPSIFQKAIAGSTDYTEALVAFQQQRDLTPIQIYERLAIADIQAAADTFKPVYEQTEGRDGYVSLEVSPFLAHDTQSTIEEARRLWRIVKRPNVMIKVPATAEGIPAIKQLIGEGINVNVTLLFSQETYEQVAWAFISGLEKLSAQGKDIRGVASVASFFVSRIDTEVDTVLAARLKTASSSGATALLQSIRGKVAIANAKLAYQQYKNILRSNRWQELARKGAQAQRLLWASTSTKNPNYRDVVYVEEMIGLDTVNTIPPATMDAFRQHGRVRASLEDDVKGAEDTMAALGQAGISMKQVADKLLKDGVRLFAEAFDGLLNTVDARCRLAMGAKIDRQTYTLPKHIASQVKETLEGWRINGKVRRLWSHDATLWTRSDEANWLAWLGVTEDQLAHSQHLTGFAEEVRTAGFTHAVLLGMGGSSLCPEVLAMTFGRIDSYPELHVLDSTDPAQIRTLENKIDLARTLFIVSSKSGTTLEPNIFMQYFFERVAQAADLSKDDTGSRFVAITDPSSKLQQAAESARFRHLFFGVPGIGGRYSALSNFGMVPAAAMGLDVRKFLDRADEMAVCCSPCLPAEENPGVILGVILGVLARNGRDKVTIVASPGIRDLGAWLEQLLAESTGKDGKGLIPVDREQVGSPDVYGLDRLFVYMRLESAPDPLQDAAIEILERAGPPAIRVSIADLYDLGQEFFRWEVATAVAGSIMGINAFNQPDVEASKVATRKLTAEYERAGALPPETPILEEKGIKLFTDEKNAASLAAAAGRDRSLAGYLRAHLNRLSTGDYFALLAYIEMNDEHEEKLQVIRHMVRNAKHVATCLGFGPRFLHSTGQAYKGGTNTGVFLQITCDDAVDLPVPGQKYTFGVVKGAQARGDFQVLAERCRRALRVHFGADVRSGLEMLRKATEESTR
jgi:transaldolase/glucose-6-phosphate isomerase